MRAPTGRNELSPIGVRNNPARILQPTARRRRPMAMAHIEALGSSVLRLRAIAAPMSESDLLDGAYPVEWNIAQVLSHLGSGAVIMKRRLDDTVASRSTPEDYAPSVWDTWNAKEPLAQRDDCLAADAALLARLQAIPDEDR